MSRPHPRAWVTNIFKKEEAKRQRELPQTFIWKGKTIGPILLNLLDMNAVQQYIASHPTHVVIRKPGKGAIEKDPYVVLTMSLLIGDTVRHWPLKSENLGPNDLYQFAIKYGADPAIEPIFDLSSGNNREPGSNNQSVAASASSSHLNDEKHAEPGNIRYNISEPGSERLNISSSSSSSSSTNNNNYYNVSQDMVTFTWKGEQKHMVLNTIDKDMAARYVLSHPTTAVIRAAGEGAKKLNPDAFATLTFLKGPQQVGNAVFTAQQLATLDLGNVLPLCDKIVNTIPSSGGRRYVKKAKTRRVKSRRSKSRRSKKSKSRRSKKSKSRRSKKSKSRRSKKSKSRRSKSRRSRKQRK